ncbi:dienelactone hydrolase family protein [Myxococcus sp. K15C18031901]|uniref:alpha/beta hydrolase family protein n=1 Tax=Myxococcus dinghuensis TaxID=2906761 RepID=UPI0020A6F04E|nr:dienelactone hydrolase family protein [Myxococcus dinghuensis]MCP3104696.1 dienelactone hydrolase family protein [Myxococcus dinghuensis]
MSPSDLFLRLQRLAPLALLLALSACATGTRGVGYRELTMKDPVGGGPMKGVVFYPSPRSSGAVDHDLARVEASQDLEPEPGRHPLVLVSHGHGGTRWGHSDLATALARRGFVVAALDHAGNTYGDNERAGSDEVWLGRALQVRALLDSVLGDAVMGPRVDPARVGAMGFSMGGYTVLLLAGAVPDLDRFEPACALEVNRQSELCTDLSEVRRTNRPELRATAEPRVRAVFSMAPVGIPFDARGLRDVTVPVRLYAAEEDVVLPISSNAVNVRDSLPRPPEYTTLPRAGHYVFLAPCREKMVAVVPELCVDPTGVDRVKLHQQLADDAERFFRRTLTTTGQER